MSVIFECSDCGVLVERATDIWRGKPISDFCDLCRERHAARVYYSTPIGKAHLAWNNLLRRVREQESYVKKGIKVRIPKARFIAWYLNALTVWEVEHPGETPSVDRIDNDGDYRSSNLQLLEIQENRVKNSQIRNAKDKAPEGTKWCPDCEKYVSTELFYQTSTTLAYSPYCKECTRIRIRQTPYVEPSGLCEECGRYLKRTAAGKVSRARHCDSCRQTLYQRRKKLG